MSPMTEFWIITAALVAMTIFWLAARPFFKDDPDGGCFDLDIDEW